MLVLGVNLVQLVPRRYRRLVVDTVEDAEAQGGPSEDLRSIPVSFATMVLGRWKVSEGPRAAKGGIGNADVR
jgi:hypothetical protein